MSIKPGIVQPMHLLLYVRPIVVIRTWAVPNLHLLAFDGQYLLVNSEGHLFGRLLPLVDVDVLK